MKRKSNVKTGDEWMEFPSLEVADREYFARFLKAGTKIIAHELKEDRKSEEAGEMKKAKPRKAAKARTRRTFPREQPPDEETVKKELREAESALFNVCDALRTLSPKDGSLMTSDDRFDMAAWRARNFADFAEHRLKGKIHDNAIRSARELVDVLCDVRDLLRTAGDLFGRIEGEMEAYQHGFSPPSPCGKCGVRPAFVQVGSSGYRLECPKCRLATPTCTSLSATVEEWEDVNADRGAKGKAK